MRRSALLLAGCLLAPTMSTAAAANDAAPDLGALLAGRPVVRQENLTIDQAVALALRYSPALAAASEAAAEADGRLGLAHAQTLPTLSANAFVAGGSEPNIVASPTSGSPSATPPTLVGLPRGAFVDGNVLLMVPLSTGGRLNALVRQAGALRQASDADRERERQDIIQATRAAYRATVALRAMADAQQARLQDSEEQLRLDRARLVQEKIPAYYVQRDEAATAAARQDLTNAQRDRDIAVVQLKTVMGVSPASRISVGTGGQEYAPSRDLLGALVGPASPMPVPDLAALLRVAERQRPELRAAASRMRGASEAAAAVRGAYRPQVSVFGMNDLQKAHGQSAFAGSSYGVAATLPLYDGGQRRAETRAANAAARREEQERQRVALQVAQEVETALLDLRAAEQNIQTATTALASAREEYRVTELRYQSGRSIVTEVLDALAARMQAEANVIQAVYQYNLAGDHLCRAVGNAPP